MGRLITLEGLDGCGKSTQLRRLAAWLEGLGLPLAVTSEPDGAGLPVRAVLSTSLTPVAELFTFLAARAQHVERRLRPWLAAGRVVLCDRFTDSSLAYQGWGRGLDPAMIAELNALATRGLEPDLTLVFDAPATLARARRGERTQADPIEAEALTFWERVRDGYRTVAAREPDRVRLIDATQPPDDVERQARRHIAQLLSRRFLACPSPRSTA